MFYVNLMNDNNFLQIFPLMRKWGATGLLIEYEDMFPYWGPLSEISSEHTYRYIHSIKEREREREHMHGVKTKRAFINSSVLNITLQGLAQK